MNVYDLIVLGGGSAGLVAAKYAKGLGKKVLLIENNKLGGECTWTGCIPSKSLIKTAQVSHCIKELSKYGLSLSSEGKLNTKEVMKNVREVVLNTYETETPEVLAKEGIEVLFGEPSFINKKTVSVAGKMVVAPKVIIATGSSPFVPPIKGLDQVSYLTNENFFDLDDVPKSLIILGGGAIGVELAGAVARLGSSVTIVEQGSTILSKEDDELTPLVAQKLVSEGVKILTNMQATEVAKDEDTITLRCIGSEEKPYEVTADALLVATGRKPNIKGLGLEQAGIAYTKHGISVDSKLRTSALNIFACGDVTGPYQFTHMADYQARIAVRNAFIPLFKKRVNYNQLVWVTFTDPEFARAGLTEGQAREENGDTIVIYRQEYKHTDRARTERVEHGLAKLICDSKGYLIGAHIYGERAGELIHELQVTKYYGKRLRDLYPVIHAYPTYSQIIWQVSKQAYIDSVEHNFVIKLLRKIFLPKGK